MKKSSTKQPDKRKYSVGDYVWAKMKGFPFWPSVITDPPDNKDLPPSKAKSYWVYFFGSKNYSWIDEEFIEPYEKERESRLSASKSSTFKKGCEEIEDCIERGVVKFDPKEDPFDKLLAADKRVSPRTPNKRLPVRSIPSPIVLSDSDEDQESKKRKASSEKSTPIKRPLLDMDIGAGPSDDCPSTLTNKDVAPSSIRFGVIITTDAGVDILNALGTTGHSVVFWSNRKIGERYVSESSPADVVLFSDVVITCLSSVEEMNETFYGSNGLLQEIKQGKSIIETTPMDSANSLELAESISASGGKYLEVRLERLQSEYLILAAGDRLLYDDCESCLNSFGKHKLFLGEVGNASKLYLAIQAVEASVSAACSDTLRFLQATGMFQKHKEAIEDVISPFSPTLYKVKEKFDMAYKDDYTTNKPISRLKQDLKSIISVGDNLSTKMSLTATVFERLKSIKGKNEELDCVYMHK